MLGCRWGVCVDLRWMWVYHHAGTGFWVRLPGGWVMLGRCTLRVWGVVAPVGCTEMPCVLVWTMHLTMMFTSWVLPCAAEAACICQCPSLVLMQASGASQCACCLKSRARHYGGCVCWCAAAPVDTHVHASCPWMGAVQLHGLTACVHVSLPPTRCCRMLLCACSIVPKPKVSKVRQGIAA